MGRVDSGWESALLIKKILAPLVRHHARLPHRRQESLLAEMGAFGQHLKHARESRGVGLDSVASATRIARHHLDALERSDLGSLPAGPFGRGYILAYADFLGIDPQPILEAYRTEERDFRLRTPDREQKMLQELSRIAGERKARARRRRGLELSRRGAALVLLALGISFLGAWVLRRGEPSGSEAPAAPGSVEKAEPYEGEFIETTSSETSDGGAKKDPKASGGITVARSGLGTGIVEHTLVGRSSRFSEGTQVSYWTLVLGGKAGDAIRHVWFREGRPIMRTELALGGPHWRTFSRYTLPPGSSGSWTVEVRGPDGQVLTREEFQCVERGEE